ncbi:MAG: hypothetical protein J6K53_07935 [Roseburia sp.]|nr:hypothetical protein [Roseburia sp.]
MITQIPGNGQGYSGKKQKIRKKTKYFWESQKIRKKTQNTWKARKSAAKMKLQKKTDIKNYTKNPRKGIMYA